MKKSLLFVAVATLFFTTAQSQNLHFGIKAGVNFSSVNGDDFDETDGVTGFQAGAVAKIGFSELIALQPEILFSAQGYSGGDTKVRLGYINIPVMADFTVVKGLSLQGGPQFGFNVISGYKEDGDEYQHFDDSDTFETFDVGVGIGAQYVLPINLFFQARYVVGFSDIAKDYDGKNATLSFSAGYFFN